MQADLDRIYEELPPQQWSYDAHYSAAMESLVGGVINEALRLFTVLPVLPKCVPPNGPWCSIQIEEQPHPLVSRTLAFVNTSATHRHPGYWPVRHGKQSGTDDEGSRAPSPVTEFDPHKWVVSPGNSDFVVETQGQQTPAAKKIFKPKFGTFVPFSEGGRGCLGYRFALVELCAVVSALFKTHSVQLDIGSGES